MIGAGGMPPHCEPQRLAAPQPDLLMSTTGRREGLPSAAGPAEQDVFRGEVVGSASLHRFPSPRSLMVLLVDTLVRTVSEQR